MLKQAFMKFQNVSINNSKMIFFKGIPLQHTLQQIRGTAIVRRVNPIYPVKMDKYDHNKRLMDKENCTYEVIEETNQRFPEPLEVLLIQPVEDIGLPGDIVEVNRNYARNYLLLLGLAVYPSPENKKKYANLASEHLFEIPSSRFAHKTVRALEAQVFSITMNLDNPWQVEPWHIRVGFRKSGFIVPEQALTIPSKPIIGPDLNLEGKEFLVKVKINNKEEAKVRFRVHHVTKVRGSNREPELVTDFEHYRAQPIFEEEAEELAALNEKDPKMKQDDV